MAYKSSPRGSSPVYMIAVHTAEGAKTAEALGNYFWRDDVQASSHVGIDDTKTLAYVPYDRAAWTIREANPVTDNAELCGFAAWTRDEWINQHAGVLHQLADWIRSRCQARGIPTNKLVPVQIGYQVWGVIGHADWTYGSSGLLGYQDGSHTDPGTNFPWDYVMARVTAQEDDLNSHQDMMLTKVYQCFFESKAAPGGLTLYDFLTKYLVPLYQAHLESVNAPGGETVHDAVWVNRSAIGEVDGKLDSLLSRASGKAAP